MNQCKVAVIAGADFNDYTLYNRYMARLKNFRDDVVLSLIAGENKLVDLFSNKFCEQHHLHIEHVAPDWSKFNQDAMQNQMEEMCEEADLIIVFWDGKTKKLEKLIEYVLLHNKPCRVVPYTYLSF